MYPLNESLPETQKQSENIFDRRGDPKKILGEVKSSKD